jgi:hypothetical protein
VRNPIERYGRDRGGEDHPVRRRNLSDVRGTGIQAHRSLDVILPQPLTRRSGAIRRSGSQRGNSTNTSSSTAGRPAFSAVRREAWLRLTMVPIISIPGSSAVAW